MSVANARAAVDLPVPFSPRMRTPPSFGSTACEQEGELEIVLADDGGKGIGHDVLLGPTLGFEQCVPQGRHGGVGGVPQAPGGGFEEALGDARRAQGLEAAKNFRTSGSAT